MDMPMARTILQRAKRQSMKKIQRESYSRNFFLVLGILVCAVLMLLLDGFGALSWSGWTGLMNVGGFLLASYFLGLLLVHAFGGLYRSMERVEDERLNALELATLGQELKSHPECLDRLRSAQEQHGVVSVLLAAQVLTAAGIYRD